MSNCIIWQAHTVKSRGDDRWQYGRFKAGGRSVLAHRYAYEQAHGPIPDGMLVLHRCDNTRCVNPAHLFLGTHAENMADMACKGRASRHGKPPRHAGDTHPRAKVSQADVEVIRSRRASGTTTSALAREYGVSATHVRRIVNGTRR